MKVVILAGGSGSRLWPVSREQFPKQFLSIIGESSMLSATVDRLSPLIDRQDVWVVTGEAHARGEAFSELDTLNKILEPCARGTAPAIAIAAAVLQDMSKEDEDPLMLMLPADHVIRNKEKFHVALKQAKSAARQGSLVTFGIPPTAPETGFGYIQAYETEDKVLLVNQFVEKPNKEKAKVMLEEGGYYWNSGMFVWKASVILHEIKEHLPDVWSVLQSMRKAWQTNDDWQAVIKDKFHMMPTVSIDYGVMEKSKNIRLIPADVGWSDVGSWDAVYEVSDKDDAGNAVKGNVLAVDCKNSLLHSDTRLLAAVGLEDIIAVSTQDAVLLTRAGESQHVRKIVDKLKLGNGSYHLEHVTVRRPWGSYTVLEDHVTGYKLKRIDVNPGCELSLQSHQHRSEHWIVVSGTATVTKGNEVQVVSKNESTFIRIGETHRLANKGKLPLQIIEVQVGDYLGEDDIQRFEDHYGRA